MTWRTLALLVAGLSVAACQSALPGQGPDDIARARKIVENHCLVATYLGGDSTGKSDSIEGRAIIYQITRGEKDWERYDAATQGVRDNVYYNTLTKQVVCGAANWRKRGIPFRPLIH